MLVLQLCTWHLNHVHNLFTIYMWVCTPVTRWGEGHRNPVRTSLYRQKSLFVRLTRLLCMQTMTGCAVGAAECAALAGLQATVAQQRVRHSFLSFKAPSLHSLRDLKTPSLHWLGVNTFRKGHQRLPWLRDSRVSTAYSLYLLLRGHDAHASPSPFSMW